MTEPTPEPTPTPQPAPERTLQLAQKPEHSFHKAIQARSTTSAPMLAGAGISDIRPVQLQAFELAGLSAPEPAQMPVNPPRDQSADVQLREAPAGVSEWLGRNLSVPAPTEPRTAEMQRLAAAGTQAPGQALPHLEAIQAAFGHHDVTGVEAHVDGEGGAAARAMGAEAFATGNDVAFDGDPTLHTAAHEAAHVVQQRGGVQLKGGVGEVGDPYEQHADAVADAVVRGDSAEGLLDRSPGGSGGGVQAKTIEVVQKQEPEPQPEGEGEGEPPTEEEIEQMVREARTEGQTAGETVADQEPPAEPPAGPPVAPAEATTPAETQRVTANPDRSGLFAATPAGPDGELPAFQGLKAGPLSKWDDETTWHEYFQGQGPLGGGGGPGAPPVQIDRDALIRDALGGGAAAGFQAGLKALAIDTAINLASSRIPYLQGFVDIAKIAYDPQAWLEGVGQNTYGNMVNGGQMLWDGITSGDPIAALDGLLTILDGINGVISTLSTICWIVAAASFVLSFICPAALPFAGLAASWGSTLGMVSTAFGLYITLGRALVVALRALQIKYGDADPATLLQQGERLRANTQQFTQSATVQVGHSMRANAQQRLQARGQARNGTQQPARQNTSTANPPTRMQRITHFLSGGITVGAAREGIDRSMAGTRAFRGTGEYATTPGGGTRSRQQQVADMEHAGLHMHTSDAARERWNQRVGGRPGVNRELVQHNQVAQQRLREAADADAAAQQRLRQAEEAAAEARRNRDAAEGDQALQARIRNTRNQNEADKQALAAAEQAVRTQEHVIRVLQERRAQEVAQGVDPMHISILDQHISQAHVTLYDRRIVASNARAAEASSNVDRIRAQMELTGTQNLDQQAQGNLETARTQAGQASSNHSTAQQDVRNANHAFGTSDRIGGMTQQQSDEMRDREANNRRQWYYDFTADGPSRLHGHNQAAGLTGSGTDIANKMSEGDTTEDGQNKPGFYGAWERTLGDQPLDMQGTSGSRGAGDDYQGRLQARFDALKQNLPAPPAGTEQTIDGARAAFSELDLEARQIAFQQEVITSLLAEGTESMTALEAMQQISAANQEAITQHQGQLDQKTQAQDELRTTSEQTSGEAEQGQQQGASTAETVGGFMSRFMEMLNLVPGRLIGGAGDGAGGIRQVSSSAEDQEQTAADAATTAQQGVTEAERMNTETEGARTEAEADNQSLQTLDQQITEGQMSTLDGQTFLQESLANAAERQALLDAEMERLRTEHGTAVETGSSWATQHETLRIEGLGELDGLVQLAESGGGGG